YAELKEVMKEVVYESLSVEEFESRWADMLVEFNVEEHTKSKDWLGDMFKDRKMWVPAFLNNYFWAGMKTTKEHKSKNWLGDMFKDRKMWVPAFLNNYFWAGMKTTQRVESINSFFDGFLERGTKFFEFPKKYCAAMNKRCSDEKNADSNCAKYIRKLVTGFHIESVFQKIYTDNKFRDVQRECERMLYCVVKEEKQISDKHFEYLMEDRVWIIVKGKSEEVLTKYKKFYVVKFGTSPMEISCVCKLFETRGILCRHCIRALETNSVVDIPEKYILRRWRKDVYRKHMHVRLVPMIRQRRKLLKGLIR
ncbi:hypothetical protein SOVF_092190, partial [Spinacia oleracea]